MFDLLFGFRLLIRAFSTDRKSLRFPYPKRIVAVFLILPLLVLFVLVNRMFMLLDWLIFPWFAFRKIEKPVFIVGTPRSATTYLYDTLASDKKQFTATHLWEMIFAPSILQKLFYRALSLLNYIPGKPVYRFSLLLDRIFFSRMKHIHAISLSKPEEDEMLLTYGFSSMMLVFFFPELAEMNKLLFFDEEMPEKKRRRIMRFYKRCVQRHLFVFNFRNDKFYLSKNPCFISKTASLAEAFPDSRLIYTLRSPFKTIPSTISLNAGLYSFFGKRISDDPLAAETRDTLIRWYKMADASLKVNWKDRHMVVPFRKFTGETEKTVSEIYRFLQIEMPVSLQAALREEEEKNRRYRSAHAYNEKSGIDDEIIRRELGFLLHGPYAGQI